MRAAVAALLLAVGCAAEPPPPPPPPADDVEATSLLGEPLRRPALDLEVAERHEAERVRAQSTWVKDPSDPEPLIRMGLENAHLGRIRDAVLVFGRGLERFPGDARFLRHRGHRYITLRRFERAVEDLTRARALIAGKPDPAEPAEAGGASGTLGSNVRAHLGLAHYLSGEWAAAEEVLQEEVALAASPEGNPDRLVAAAYWLVLALHRQGRGEEAAPVLALIDPRAALRADAGHRRVLLLFAGELGPVELAREAAGDGPGAATCGYGLGAWHLAQGRADDARRAWEAVVGKGEWMAFARIAAEAELARLRR